MESTNFAFLKGINDSYYNDICSIEKNARTQPKVAAQKCRDLLENFVHDVQRENNIAQKKGLHGDIVSVVSDKKKGVPGLIPKLSPVKFEAIDYSGTIKEENSAGIFFLKKVGNAGAHRGLPTKGGESFAVINSDVILLALRKFHELFKSFFKDNLKGQKIVFQDMNVPIGEYSILTRYIPVDSERSGCIAEYRAEKTIGRYGTKQIYAVIREYISNEMDSLFLNRNIDAFGEAYEHVYKEGVSVRNLNDVSEPYANFFVAYEFPDEVVQLDKFLKKNKLNLKDKIQICKDVAESLYGFHVLESPVYHRMLNHTCIMISAEEGMYKPYITKFDFAKITSIKEGTVYRNLSAAEEKETVKFSRYKIDDLSPDSNWEKIDIYSLGVLFVDIMLNGVSSRGIDEKTFDDLIDAGISDGMLDIIDEMLSEIPEDRPDIGMVLSAIKKEYALHE